MYLSRTVFNRPSEFNSSWLGMHEKKTMPASIHHDLFIYNLQFRYNQPKAPQFIVPETST